MESFEIAAFSMAAGLPVAVVRSVSDSPGSRMPDLNRALAPTGDFNNWRLATVLAVNPFATFRLFRASRLAIAALGQALDAIFSGTPLLGQLASVKASDSLGLLQGQK